MARRSSMQQPLALGSASREWQPLADRMRPRNVEEFVALLPDMVERARGRNEAVKLF